jgi:hypothetical protein
MISMTEGVGKALFKQVFPPEQWKVHGTYTSKSIQHVLLVRKDQRTLNPDAAIVEVRNATTYPWVVIDEGGAWILSEKFNERYKDSGFFPPLPLEYDKRWNRKALEAVEAEPEPPPVPENPHAKLANYGRF